MSVRETSLESGLPGLSPTGESNTARAAGRGLSGRGLLELVETAGRGLGARLFAEGELGRP